MGKATIVENNTEQQDLSFGDAIELVAMGFIHWCEGCQCYHLDGPYTWRNVSYFLRTKHNLH